MKKEYRHKVLIVDDESTVIKAICRTLRPLSLETDTSENGATALEIVKSSDTPFSMIISDQRMPGMLGTEFLAKCKRVSPHTVRILMTGYSSMDTIIDAVNKGAVHRYIAKPWDLDDFLDTIRQGLSRYEEYLNLQHLLSTAKQQNGKLYALSRELMEKAKTDNLNLKALDEEISELDAMLGTGTAPPGELPKKIGEEILRRSGSSETGQAELDRIYTAAVEKLAHAFNDLAMRNGFEMPESVVRGADDG